MYVCVYSFTSCKRRSIVFICRVSSSADWLLTQHTVKDELALLNFLPALFGVPGLHMCITTPSFMEYWRSNTGLHAFEASSGPTEPRPQPQEGELLRMVLKAAFPLISHRKQHQSYLQSLHQDSPGWCIQSTGASPGPVFLVTTYRK